MTELSYPWTCVAVGDGSPYDLEIVEARARLLGNVNPAQDGVIFWNDSTVFPDMTNPTDELLLPEFVSGNTVRINSGVGMVQGWMYFNDADVDTDVSGGNANAVDVIGLRRDLAGQTVRIFHGQGAAGSTYSLVQTTATWEVPLAYVTLDGSGNYSSLADARTLVKSPTNDRVLLYEKTITAAEEAALTTAITVPQQPYLFKDLVIEMTLRTQGTSYTQTATVLLSGLGGNVYAQIIQDATVISNGDTGSNLIFLTPAANGTDSWANLYSKHILKLYDYTNSLITQEFQLHQETVQTFAGKQHTVIDTYGNRGNSTPLITGITITTTGTTWLAGSTVRVYGVH